MSKLTINMVISVCSTTIWVGHLAKTVAKENLQELFEANQLAVSSIDVCIHCNKISFLCLFCSFFQCCQEEFDDSKETGGQL